MRLGSGPWGDTSKFAFSRPANTQATSHMGHNLGGRGFTRPVSGTDTGLDSLGVLLARAVQETTGIETPTGVINLPARNPFLGRGPGGPSSPTTPRAQHGASSSIDLDGMDWTAPDRSIQEMQSSNSCGENIDGIFTPESQYGHWEPGTYHQHEEQGARHPPQFLHCALVAGKPVTNLPAYAISAYITLFNPFPSNTIPEKMMISVIMLQLLRRMEPIDPKAKERAKKRKPRCIYWMRSKRCQRAMQGPGWRPHDMLRGGSRLRQAWLPGMVVDPASEFVETADNEWGKENAWRLGTPAYMYYDGRPGRPEPGSVGRLW